MALKANKTKKERNQGFAYIGVHRKKVVYAFGRQNKFLKKQQGTRILIG